MIAKIAPQRRSGRGSFATLRTYLEREQDGSERADLLGTWSGNVASHTTADLEMDAIGQRGRSDDPLLHIVLSWRPGEDVSEETVSGAIEATLQSLGAEDRQWFAALHNDPEDPRAHLHLAINRVDPESRRMVDLWKSHAKLARAAEWVEREFGCLPDRRMDWRAQTPEIDLGPDGPGGLSPDAPAPDRPRPEAPAGLSLAPPGAATPEMDAARRAGYSWARLVQDEAVPAAQAVLARDGATWEHVHASLETYGLRMVPAGSGARIVGAEPGLHLKASRVGLDVRALEAQLGPFVEPAREATAYEARLAAAREAAGVAKTWPELHAGLAEAGLALDGGARGGQVVDLETDGRKAACRAALGASLSQLEARLGPHEVAPAIVERQAREEERRAATIAERVELLVAEPGLVVARIAEMRSTWDRAEAEREIRGVLDVGESKAWDAAVARVAEAALAPGQVVSLGFVPGVSAESPREVFSTAAIVAEERALHAAARTLAERARTPERERAEGVTSLRAPAPELDTQQQGAYAAIAGGTGLSIVQGIAGAGKSRMLRDVAEAYEEAGYRVLGAAVSGDAARVLGEEAQIPTQTVARLRMNLSSGGERLDARTVLLIDEASMLGTSDARVLLEAARDGGASVRLLGDAEQHGSVARGNVLADLSKAYGAYDMARSRRAQEPWLREVAADLRAGLTPRALDALRAHGSIAEHRTTDEAKTALIAGWAADVRAEREVLLIATRRKDVAELNELARAALADKLGEARPYTTAFGAREIAVGEQLIARKADRDSETVNGDRLRVLGHREDGRIACERIRDGAKLLWDVQQRPEIDYGYAATSYRSQGRTVDAVHVLATQADDRRGLYVDATRARERVRIAYGRDEVTNFGSLLALGARERLGRSVTGAERAIEAAQLTPPRTAEPERPVAVKPVERAPERVEEPATESAANSEAKPERKTRTVHLLDLEFSLSDEMAELRKRSEAARELRNRGRDGAWSREATTAAEVIAHERAASERRVKAVETAAEAQFREKNQGLLGLTRSAEQRERDDRTAKAYEAEVARDESARAWLADPAYAAEVERTLEAGRVASDEIQRSQEKRDRLRVLASTLKTIGIERVEVPDMPGRSISERLSDAMTSAVSLVRENASRFSEIEEHREQTRSEQRERERTREYRPEIDL